MPDNQNFAEIILPLALPMGYTYALPDTLKSNAQPGKRAIVQFGKKRYYTGIIAQIHGNEPKEYDTKEIISILDDNPIVNSFQLAFWKWIAEYYCCTVGEVYKAALPSGLKLESETKIVLDPEAGFNGQLSDDETITLNFLENNMGSDIGKIAAILGKKNALKTIDSLIEKKLVFVEERLKQNYKPKYETYVCLGNDFKNEDKLHELFAQLKRAPQQEKIFLTFLAISKYPESSENSNPTKSALLQKANAKDQALKELVKKGILVLYKQQIDRIQFLRQKLLEPKPLLDFQNKAYREINSQFKEKNVVLLHGITSSGKTEIYIHLIKKEIDKGKQVLYLLPEIALTSQIINRLGEVFGRKAVVYHSKFSDNERVEVYNEVNKNEAILVLGVRSSVFLPFKNLGLVIVDEEHENTYKQFDPAPRYNARDVSIVLAQMHKAKVLLGTATPSIESYYNAKVGKYGLVGIYQRFKNIELPEIIVANALKARNKKLMKADFTPTLFEEINNALEKNEQVILFQNRRGFSPYIECNACGWVPYCNNCDVSLTYHKYINRMVCHYCGFGYAMPHSCKACGSTGMEIKGFGTEKIESDISILFPDAKIARMDLDSTRKKHAASNIIADFENRKIDILVGTQMVTKGLDFDCVGLVGILNADSLLNFPDFRAFERAFQLMAQVGGRAGRKSKKGKVVIQTANPEHFIIKCVSANNYIAMFRTQLAERKKFKYPPFYRLITITVKHKKPEILDSALETMTQQLKSQFKENVFGPQAPLISRVQNWYLKNYLLKLEKGGALPQAKQYLLDLASYVKSQPSFSTLQIIINVDPQ